MKITLLCPQNEFALALQKKLSKLGDITYTQSRRAYSLSELKKLTIGTDILAIDPDNLGGWEQIQARLQELVKTLPKLKGLALDTTAFHYVNLNYCRQQKIKVTYVPGYSSESVAEHSLALLMGLMKRIFCGSRVEQTGQSHLVMGYELKGKTLGIIGLGKIGQKMADLANGIGMKVIAYNRTAKQYPGVKLLPLKQVLAQADALSLHLATNAETKGFLNQQRLAQAKTGVFIVNTADRALIDEVVLAAALKDGKVDSYALEADDFTTGPLAKLKNVFFFKGFGWYTKEALAENKKIWVANIAALCQGKTINPVPNL